MAELQKHLYLILHPNEALVASQLSPEAFGSHYSIGSPRHFTGKVIFAEVDINFRTEYLRIDEYLAQVTAHPDGTPKRTKFVKSYRVLEHIDLAALKKLYLVTTDGAVLGLDASEDPADARAGRVHVYQEICPLKLVVASSLSPRQFGAYITEGTWSKGAPKIFFTQWDIDAETVVKTNETRSFSMGPLPNVNPTNLPTALRELAEDRTKKTKTISLNGSLDLMSYKNIQPGFWFSDGADIKFYKMPTIDELATTHRSWWRHV
jgi:hypothetical protein